MTKNERTELVKLLRSCNNIENLEEVITFIENQMGKEFLKIIVMKTPQVGYMVVINKDNIEKFKSETTYRELDIRFATQYDHKEYCDYYKNNFGCNWNY